MEGPQWDAFTEACEGTHALMNVEHRSRVGCTYIKYNLRILSQPSRERNHNLSEFSFLFFFGLFMCYFCFLGLVLCLVQKAHKHTCGFLQILH